MEDGNFAQSQCLSINILVLDFNGGDEVDVQNHPVISDWGHSYGLRGPDIANLYWKTFIFSYPGHFNQHKINL